MASALSNKLVAFKCGFGEAGEHIYARPFRHPCHPKRARLGALHVCVLASLARLLRKELEDRRSDIYEFLGVTASLPWCSNCIAYLAFNNECLADRHHASSRHGEHTCRLTVAGVSFF
jgi:hypothetical protein